MGDRFDDEEYTKEREENTRFEKGDLSGGQYINPCNKGSHYQTDIERRQQREKYEAWKNKRRHYKDS